MAGGGETVTAAGSWRSPLKYEMFMLCSIWCNVSFSLLRIAASGIFFFIDCFMKRANILALIDAFSYQIQCCEISGRCHI